MLRRTLRYCKRKLSGFGERSRCVGALGAERIVSAISDDLSICVIPLDRKNDADRTISGKGLHPDKVDGDFWTPDRKGRLKATFQFANNVQQLVSTVI